MALAVDFAKAKAPLPPSGGQRLFCTNGRFFEGMANKFTVAQAVREARGGSAHTSCPDRLHDMHADRRLPPPAPRLQLLDNSRAVNGEWNASQVDIMLTTTSSGRKMLCVTDNGRGMSPTRLDEAYSLGAYAEAGVDSDSRIHNLLGLGMKEAACAIGP
jgi:hypothetical protein